MANTINTMGYVHIHSLLSHVEAQLREWDEDIDTTQYERLGVRPTDIHKSASDQKEAMFTLLNELSTHIERSSEDPRVPIQS